MQAGFNYWRSMCWVQRTAFSASCSELWPWLVWWFYYTCNHIFKLAILSGKWMFWQLTIFSSFAVYCESCMSAQVNVPLKCQVCHCTHPGDFPKFVWSWTIFWKNNSQKNILLGTRMCITGHHNLNVETRLSVSFICTYFCLRCYSH